MCCGIADNCNDDSCSLLAIDTAVSPVCEKSATYIYPVHMGVCICMCIHVRIIV